MKSMWCLIGVYAVAPVLADPPIDVSRLAWTVTSALSVDRNDKRIARSMKGLRLTERLTAETAGQLVEIGAGPYTVRVLETLQKQFANLPLPAEVALSITPVPSASEQDQMIGKMRAYVAAYLARFPDFLATKEVRQYHNYRILHAVSSFPGHMNAAPAIDNNWHIAGTYNEEAAYVAGCEYRKQTPAGGEKGRRIFRVSNGEFGGMMEEIFEPGRAAQFGWDRWQMLNGSRLAVFSYRVDLLSSRYAVCCLPAAQPSGKSSAQNVKAGHRGLVFADPRSGAVMRLILIADGFAGNVDSIAAGHVLEYGEVAVGAGRYLLPLRAIAYVRLGRYESRDEIEYRNYRKFASDAEINFAEDTGADPKD